MSDVEYNLLDVPNRYQDVIQRMAVMHALRAQLPNTDEQVRAATYAMIEQWRARIGTLAAAGWEPKTGPNCQHVIAYARNCRPTFCMTTYKMRPCSNRLICPWCYARWVREVWMNIDGSFPAPDPIEPDPLELEAGREFRSIVLENGVSDAGQSHRTVFRFHLVERHHVFYRPVVPTDNPRGITLADQLTGILQQVELRRKEIVRQVDPVGAFIYTTVEPYDQGRQWKLHHRQLFKMTPEQDFPANIAENTNGSLRRFARPARRVILQAVARACRYPTALMVGDAERTVQLLDIRRRSNFRGHARFRGFRNRQYE